MIFTETKLPGVFLIDLEPREDERGFFARSFCQREFAEHGLETAFVQCNISYNRARGTLRGMHYNRPPHEEAKLVRCEAGAIYDVVVDIRRDSPTASQWVGVELSQESRRMVYVPKGLAHGFLTLRDDTQVFYQMSDPHVPGAGLGLRYDDPAIAIDWPEEPRLVSERDRGYPDWTPEGADA